MAASDNIYYFPCTASRCYTVLYRVRALEERDLIFGPLSTIVTSASSELGTDCSVFQPENCA